MALMSEIERRGLDVPKRFDVPDRELWTTGFPRAVRRAIAPPASKLDDALAIVCPFVDRVLDGAATGEWDPETKEWGRA